MTTVNTPNQTRQVYDYITACAEKGTTSTYQEIAIACGIVSSGNRMGAVLSPILSNIFLFCLLHEMPYLTSIVVRKSGNEQGLPGGGFWKLLERTNDSAMYDAIFTGSRARKQTVTKGFQTEVFGMFRGGYKGNLDLALLDIADEESDHLALMWNQKAGKAELLRKPVDHGGETAWLTAEQTDNILEQMREKIAREFGVTLQQDHNGAGGGDAGSRYLTLRFGDFTVSTKILSVASHKADVDLNLFLNEEK